MFTGIRSAYSNPKWDCKVMVESSIHFSQKLKIYWNKLQLAAFCEEEWPISEAVEPSLSKKTKKT